MADKTSSAALGADASVANVTTAGSIAVNATTIVFDEATPDSVEISAAIERATIQFLDYMADKT